jgi:hypothetical protein
MKELKFASIRDAIQHLADLIGQKIKIAAHYDTAKSTSSLNELHRDLKSNFIGIAQMRSEEEELKLKPFLSQMLNLSRADVENYIKVLKAHKGDIGEKLVFEEFLPEIGKDFSAIPQDMKTHLVNLSKNIKDWHRISKGERQKEIYEILQGAIDSVAKNEKDRNQLVQTIHSGLDSAMDSVLDKKNQEKYLDNPEKLFAHLKGFIKNRATDAWRTLSVKKSKDQEITEREKIEKGGIDKEPYFDIEDESDAFALEQAKKIAKEKLDKKFHKVVDLIFELILGIDDDMLSLETVLKGGFSKEGLLQGRTLLNKNLDKFTEAGIEVNDQGDVKAQQFDKVLKAVEEAIQDMISKAKRGASMKFASVSEAIQHLSDLTGESIKIATKGPEPKPPVTRDMGAHLDYVVRRKMWEKEISREEAEKEIADEMKTSSSKIAVDKELKSIDIREVSDLFKKEQVEKYESGQEIDLEDGSVRIWISPDDGNYIVQWIDSTGRIAPGSEISVESFKEAIDKVDDIRPDYI